MATNIPAAPEGRSSWIMRVLIAFDRLMNAVFRGKDQETISRRAARARGQKKRWGCLLCAFLDKLDPGHCDREISINTVTTKD